MQYCIVKSCFHRHFLTDAVKSCLHHHFLTDVDRGQEFVLTSMPNFRHGFLALESAVNSLKISSPDMTPSGWLGSKHQLTNSQNQPFFFERERESVKSCNILLSRCTTEAYKGFQPVFHYYILMLELNLDLKIEPWKLKEWTGPGHERGFISTLKLQQWAAITLKTRRKGRNRILISSCVDYIMVIYHGFSFHLLHRPLMFPFHSWHPMSKTKFATPTLASSAMVAFMSSLTLWETPKTEHSTLWVLFVCVCVYRYICECVCVCVFVSLCQCVWVIFQVKVAWRGAYSNIGAKWSHERKSFCS